MSLTPQRHVPVLDGVRGAAILLVLGYHLSVVAPEASAVGRGVEAIFSKGWVGVNLFFVLSGYLITQGLVAPSAYGTGARMRRFYVRRALRIFPLYYATIAIATLVCVTARAPIPGIRYWLYVHNYTQALAPDPQLWTRHLWSLAVEEQFYLAWPALVLFFPRARVPVTATLIAGSLAARVVVAFTTGWDVERVTYYATRATFTCVDALLIGALVTIVESQPESATARAWRRARAPGLLALLVLYGVPRVLAARSDVLARVTVCLEPLVIAYGFAVIISAAVEAVHAPSLARVLEAPWLRACGRVSYGMYVFHWPLIEIAAPHLQRANAALGPARAAAMDVALVPAGAAVVYALAWVSYRYFESPFLRLKERFSG